jgi:threonine synthase
MRSSLTHLECSRPGCGQTLDCARPQNLCPACRGPLLARYDLAKARRTFSRDALHMRIASMWRYEEVMPPAAPVTLGEGMTPLLHAHRLGEHLADGAIVGIAGQRGLLLMRFWPAFGIA